MFKSILTLLTAVVMLSQFSHSQEYILGERMLVGGTGVQHITNSPSGVGPAFLATIGQGIAGREYFERDGNQHYVGFWDGYSIFSDVQEQPSSEELINLNNYPNPFDNATTISFNLNSTSDVSVKIYDLNGNLVRTLYDGFQSAGLVQLPWNAKYDDGFDAESGTYLYEVLIKPHGGAMNGKRIQARNIMVLTK